MEPLYFNSTQEWRSWLAHNGEKFSEVWLGFYKKNSKKKGIAYDESVEQALCFGWIDGLTKRVDEDSYKIRFTPRRAKGNWSLSNIQRVEKLIHNGQMTAAGLKHVEAAKLDGRWEKTLSSGPSSPGQ